MLVSDYDQRSFSSVTLENGVRVLIVSDKNCKKSALSISIAAGHFQDPDDCHGLAHLHEHMMFMGSKNCPEANQLSDFLSHFSGNINAWTSTEHSCFHLEVLTPKLPEATHMLTDMLCNPLFELSSIEKEIQAIDAEFKLKQKDDLRRLYQVHKETCNPQHPFSKFSVGNADTFNQHSLDSLKQQLQTFHQDYYIGERICICIVTDAAVEDAEQLARAVFCEFSGKKSPEAQPVPELYLKQQLGVQINIKPVKQARRLIVTFALPDVQADYRSKPLAYISHLLGDEGEGSLLALFKAQNWATSLSAGGGINGSNFKDFNLNLQLTEQGMHCIPDILNCIYHYLELIRQDADTDWRINEKATLNKLAFDFSDRSKPMDEAISLSNQMFHYPAEHVVAGDYLLDQLTADCLGKYLDYFVPDNMRMKIIHLEVETDSTAAWYDTPYKIEPLPAEVIAHLKKPYPVKGLSLPSPNPYLVSDMNRSEKDERFRYPNLIKSAEGLNIWFAQDHKFGQPKGDCFISFDTYAGCQSAESATFKRLWVSMVMEQFNQSFYQAGVAGLHYHLYPHQAGFSLHTNGFSQKQLALCENLFERLFCASPDPQYFDQVRNKQLQALQNALLNKPINRLFTRLSVVLQRYAYAPQEVLPIVQSASIEQINACQSAMLNNFYLEAFFHGDWSDKEVRNTAAILSSHCTGKQAGHKISRDVVDLAGKGRLLHVVDCQHDDAAAVVYFQAPSSGDDDVAKMILTEQLIAGMFFNQIRTEKQMGYLVGTGYMPYNQHPGMAFYIQSPNFPAMTLVSEIEQFIQQTLSQLTQLEQMFESVKASVVKQLVEKDTNLGMKSQRLWMAIGNDDTAFEQQNKLAEAIQAVNIDQLQQFSNQLIARERFGELVLLSPGKLEFPASLSGTVIDDIASFKQSCKYTI